MFMRELGDFYLIKVGILDEYGFYVMVDNFFWYYYLVFVCDVYWVFVVLLIFFVVYFLNSLYFEM